jgi:hypothetical protein
MFTTASLKGIAESQVGYHEGRSNGHWNNDQKYSTELPGFDWSNKQPWCDTFANWLYWQIGVAVPTGARSASCATSLAAYKKAGRFTLYPVVGAQVFYALGGGTTADHTGVVIKYDDTYVYTVEGNTNTNGSAEGDGVYDKKRVRRAASVLGYGVPYFHSKGESPDPKWNGKDLSA